MSPLDLPPAIAVDCIHSLALLYMNRLIATHTQSYAVLMSVHSLHHSGVRSGMFASTNNTPWAPSSLNISFIAWMAASQPAIWFPHNCTDPTEDWISLLTAAKTAYAIMRWGTSPIPIGQTQGSLSTAIKWEATKRARTVGRTYTVHRCFATSDSKSSDADLKEVHIRFQSWHLNPMALLHHLCSIWNLLFV